MRSRLVINALGYLGLVPFLTGSWLIVTERALLNLNTSFIFASYSAIILTFLGGTLWGRCLVLANSLRRNLLLLVSNLLALLAWFSLLGSDQALRLSLTSLVFGYLIAQIAETLFLSESESAMDWPYSKMRLLLTVLVVTTHVVVFVSL